MASSQATIVLLQRIAISAASVVGYALESTLQQVLARLPPLVESSIPLAGATGMVTRLAPTGARVQAQSQAVVLATDHADVPVAVQVDGADVSDLNPLPVLEPDLRHSALGAVAPAVSGIISAAPAKLYELHLWYNGAGADYLMLFDTDIVGGIAVATQILPPGFPLSAANRHAEVVFPRGLAFGTGVAWAMSTDPNTFAASAQTARVTAQWI